MILLIDNYDSFTHNLAHLIGGLGEEVVVHRNDAVSVENALTSNATAIFISPGPGVPENAGICVDLITAAATVHMPIFGVCLGMQAIAKAFGGSIKRADKQMHGKTCSVAHDTTGLFSGVPSPFTAARYHSLVADGDHLPDTLTATAHAKDDGEIMALAHATLPIAGVQFHPESIASEHGPAIIANFLDWAKK